MKKASGNPRAFELQKGSTKEDLPEPKTTDHRNKVTCRKAKYFYLAGFALLALLAFFYFAELPESKKTEQAGKREF